MASKNFLTPINLLNLASDPSTASEGDIYFNTADDVVKVYADGVWTSVGSGEQQTALVKNVTGSTIEKGKAVYINGAQGQRPTVALADADTETTSSKVFGITADSILNEAEGFVVTEGMLRGLNTEGLTEGGAIWLSSTAGNFTQTVPTQPAHSVFLGYVVKAHVSSGEIFVKIQNGYELEELHNVLIDGTPADNEVLAYDTTSGLWKNQTAAEAGLAASNHNHTINSLSNVVITGTPTDGQALVWDTTTSKWVNETVSGSSLTEGNGIDITSGVVSADLTVVAPLASPTFTGDVVLPTTTTIGGISTSNYALIDGQTFTGLVVLPTTASYTTSLGTIGDTELKLLVGLTENVQDVLDVVARKVGGLIEVSDIPTSIARAADYIPLSQRGQIDGVAPLDGNAKVPLGNLDLSLYATLESSNFTGNITLPSTTSIGDVSSTVIGYLTGISSSVQAQINDRLEVTVAASTYLTITDASDDYQAKDADLTAIAELAGTNGFLKKAGANTWVLDDSTYLTTDIAASTYLDIDDAINSYATLAAPTFTGIVVLPSTTSIGTVSATEIGYLDGVTSSIQTQLNGKQASHDHPYQTQNASLSSISSLAGTAGFIKFDGGSTYSVDSNTYLVRNQPTVDTAIIAGTTTFNIANAIATTLNIGGAATAITIGSTNANAETIIRTPKINSNASSIQLFNTTSTTVEFAGAATTLHIGGTSTAGSTFNIAANATASGNQKIVNLATDAASGSSTVINIGTSNDGTVNVYGDVVIDGTIEVPTPLTNAQAANKGYVDALAAGINIKQQGKYATTTALGVTYTAGSSDTSGGLGEGAFITATSNGAFSPDGTEVVTGERILVKNQTDAKQNGIYIVTDPGDGDSPFILTRAADFNGESATNGIVKNGDYVFITGGSVNSNASFVISQGGTSTTPSGAIKFGTDSVVFSQYSGVPGNITSLGVVTQGVWQSTRIQKEYLDDELATLNNPTFTGTVTVPAPVVNTDAATKAYVDNSIAANAAALPDIIPLDDIRGQFNGIDSRFQPTFQGETLSILNPLRLLVSVNGIIQTVDFPEYVWQSFLPKEGFMVDNDGYIAFSEVPPAGSTFDARLMPGPNINSVKKGYPFRAVDILLGV